MVNCLDRYILTLFNRVFLLSIAAFAGLYLLVDFFEKVDNFLGNHASPTLYLLYFACKLPLIITQVLPLAMLMAVFMTLGGLSRTSELTAMRAGGLSLWRIAAPLLIVSVGLSLLLLAASEFLIPASARTMNHIYEVEVKGKPELNLRRENIWFREGKKIIHIRLALPENGTLDGITIYGMDDGFRFISRLDAQEAIYQTEGWLFRRVIERTFTPATGELFDLRQLAEIRYPLDKSPEDFVVPDNKNLELGIRELRRLIDKLQIEGYNATRYRVDLQARLATPFACLILAFLGIPFALQKGRGTNFAVGIAVSVAIGISYFILQAMLQAFGYSGVLPPVVAAWAANLLFGLLSIWLLLSVRE
jgi:lipopolysaccharide export system permease protein